MYWYAFLRPWKHGYSQGIGLYTSYHSRHFTIELGVVPANFFAALSDEKAFLKRELGLRERLGLIVHGDRHDLSSWDRDWVPYEDQASLEEPVGKWLGLALVHGPAVWDRFGRALLDSD